MPLNTQDETERERLRQRGRETDTEREGQRVGAPERYRDRQREGATDPKTERHRDRERAVQMGSLDASPTCPPAAPGCRAVPPC